MQYVVQTVDDGDLPDGIDHVIVERDGAVPLLLISGAPARCWLFMEAYRGAFGTEVHDGTQVAQSAERLLLAI